MIDARRVAIQGVGAAPLLMAVQGLLALVAPPPPPPPAAPGRGLVYSPSRSPLRSPVRDVVRW